MKNMQPLLVSVLSLLFSVAPALSSRSAASVQLLWAGQTAVQATSDNGQGASRRPESAHGADRLSLRRYSATAARLRAAMERIGQGGTLDTGIPQAACQLPAARFMGPASASRQTRHRRPRLQVQRGGAHRAGAADPRRTRATARNRDCGLRPLDGVEQARDDERALLTTTDRSACSVRTRVVDDNGVAGQLLTSKAEAPPMGVASKQQPPSKWSATLHQCQTD